MNQQQLELKRVKGKIAPHVLAFFREHEGATFTADDLLDYVRRRHGRVAPDSPNRIMRVLKKAGELNYDNVDRAGSRYVVVSMGARQAA